MNGWCPMNRQENVQADISKALELAKEWHPKFEGLTCHFTDDQKSAYEIARALIEQQSTLERYKAALEWYADPLSHSCIQHQEGDLHFMHWTMASDQGAKAREALEGGK